ncbi:hypothetical protein BG000_009527 [Podila horticola]|nr:hypothetical protein BG000_009527 [Podila horticola]
MASPPLLPTARPATLLNSPATHPSSPATHLSPMANPATLLNSPTARPTPRVIIQQQAPHHHKDSKTDDLCFGW